MANLSNFKDLYNYANLEKDEEIYLFQNLNQQNRDVVIQSHLKLALKIASQYLFLEQSTFDDIVQCGFCAIVQSVDSFDPSLGFRFSTYIRPKIQSSIKSFLRKNCLLWSTSEKNVYLMFKLLELSENQIKTKGTLLDIKKLSSDLNIQEKKAKDLFRLYSSGGTDLFYSYYLHIKSIKEDNKLKLDVEKMLNYIPEQHRRILKLRYYDDKTWREIGEIINKSHEGARKIHNKAISFLRKKSIK